MRSRVPKMVYAPPEFFKTFEHPLRETDFDELLAGDIYSMALLFWEISNKGKCSKMILYFNKCFSSIRFFNEIFIILEKTFFRFVD